MTTPNEELMALADRYATLRIGEGTANARKELHDAMQSQAERIAELERESETHSKAYGLAIVERDNLRHELKVAQEGWRCECSTDDACRFARERDALRAELGDLPEAQAEMLAEIKRLRAQLAEIAATEPAGVLRPDEFDGHVFEPTKDWPFGPLFTHPMPAKPQDHEIRELVDRLTAIAKEYGQTQQLRECIAQEIRPFTLTKPAESKDAERYRWLAAYLVSNDTLHDDALIDCASVDAMTAFIDAKGTK
jgi:hypothetical protein